MLGGAGGHNRPMCGRYTLTVEPEVLFGTFAADPDEGAGGPAALYGGDAPRPRYNIAPTVTVPVVRLDPRRPPTEQADDPTRRQVEPMRWGLVPSWAKDASVGNRMFNARAESLADKPAFRRALARRRCLVPASGWYEWRKLPGPAGDRKVRKQAYYMTPQDGSLLAFAGLWEYWKPADDPDGEAVVSMTIVTTASVGPLQDVHERMPLVLPAAEWSDWLSPDVDPTPLLTTTPEALVEALELRPIGPRVGAVANDDADLLRRVEPDGPDTTPARPTGAAARPEPGDQLALDFPNPS